LVAARTHDYRERKRHYRDGILPDSGSILWIASAAAWRAILDLSLLISRSKGTADLASAPSCASATAAPARMGGGSWRSAAVKSATNRLGSVLCCQIFSITLRRTPSFSRAKALISVGSAALAFGPTWARMGQVSELIAAISLEVAVSHNLIFPSSLA